MVEGGERGREGRREGGKEGVEKGVVEGVEGEEADRGRSRKLEGRRNWSLV